MTWTSSTTPDDIAQQGDSLVASIIREGQASQPPTPTTEESSAVQPGWMRNAIKSIRWRQRLGMNLPRDWDPDKAPDL